MDRDQKVSLGCGTLILISLIVITFGNLGGKDTAAQVSNLRYDVQKLEKTVAAQTRQIESLEQTVARKLAPTTMPATGTTAGITAAPQ